MVNNLNNILQSHLLDLSHDLVGIPGAGGLHGPREPQGPRLDLSGLVDHVGDVALAARSEGPVHADSVLLAPPTAHTEAPVHPPVTRQSADLLQVPFKQNQNFQKFIYVKILC